MTRSAICRHVSERGDPGSLHRSALGSHGRAALLLGAARPGVRLHERRRGRAVRDSRTGDSDGRDRTVPGHARTDADTRDRTDTGARACTAPDGGEVHCWGLNHVGQASAPPGRYTAVSVDGSRSCALSERGEVVCWGAGWSPPPGQYVALSTNERRICAVTEGGEVVCSGDDEYREPDVH